MSDAGIYAALEADLKTKIEGTNVFVTVAPSLSVRDLVNRDGIRKPAAGIILTEARDQGPARGVNAPHRYSLFTFQVALAFNDARGAVSSRPLAETALETIRGAVHFTQPSGMPLSITGLWMWQGETFPEEQPEGLIVAAANFSISLMVGN